jgi:2-hydroxy-3-keto-5-methylthiopentenyl-1-phosphate phosphatase
MTDSDFRSIAAKSKMACRHGMMELFNQTKTHNMPFVVVSGGVKEVIDVILYEIIRENNVINGGDAS